MKPHQPGTNQKQTEIHPATVRKTNTVIKMIAIKTSAARIVMTDPEKGHGKDRISRGINLPGHPRSSGQGMRIESPEILTSLLFPRRIKAKNLRRSRLQRI